MPKGSSSRSGPPPDPNALRRERDGKDWITLPQEGRKGKVPAWPLDIGATAAESKLWKLMWKKPQAVMWEQQGQHHEVALYVRKFIEASAPKAQATIVTAQRQMADSLGITDPGLRSNRWKIGVPVAEEQKTNQATVSSRERFRVVDGAG